MVIFIYKKVQWSAENSEKHRRPLLKNTVVRRDKREKGRQLLKNTEKSGKRRLFNKTLVHRK